NDTLSLRRTVAADSLRARMAKDTILAKKFADETTFNATIDTTSSVAPVKSLVKSRENQRQDWISYTLFLTLADGLDAFVAAHLADFPATIQPLRTGGMQLK